MKYQFRTFELTARMDCQFLSVPESLVERTHDGYIFDDLAGPWFTFTIGKRNVRESPLLAMDSYQPTPLTMPVASSSETRFLEQNLPFIIIHGAEDGRIGLSTGAVD